MIHFDLADLKLFLAVEETKSISKAAGIVHLATSSASARLAELERRLDVKLFERGARGVEPTGAARVFSTSARKILDEANRLQSSLVPFLHGSEATIRIASNYNASVSFLPADIGPFMKRHPFVMIDIEQLGSDQVIERVSSGLADLGVTAVGGDRALLEFFPYHQDELVVIVPSEHPLAVRESVSIAELLGESFVAIGPQSALQDFVFAKAREAGGVIRPKIRVTTNGAALSLVSCGAGVSIIPKSAYMKEINEIRVVALEDDWNKRTLRICVRRDRLGEMSILKELVESLSGAAAEATVERVG